MVSVDGHAIGMRELRHQTREVLDRVQQGETIDITDYGRLVARIVPVPERTPTPVLQRLIDSGRVTPATRPGFMARMHTGDGTDRLGDALADQRADDRW
jgi:prevent-host-death family protein